jgi:hypothetical protein
MATLAQFGQTSKVSTRQAQINADLQNSTSTTKGTRNFSNPNADFVEANVQTNYQEAGSEGPNVLSPEQQALNDQAMRLADANNYVAKPGYNPAATASTTSSTTTQKKTPNTGEDLLTIAALRGQARLDGKPMTTTDVQGALGNTLSAAQLKKQQDDERINGITITYPVTRTDTNGNKVITQSIDEKATAAAREAEREKIRQENMAAQKAQQDKNISGANATEGANQKENEGAQPLDGLLANVDPTVAAGIQDYVDQSNDRIKELETMEKQGKIDLETSLKEQDKIKREAEAVALKQKEADLAFNEKQDALNRQAIENAKLDAEGIIRKQQAQSDLNDHIAYHNQEVQNTETEMQNRNAAAKLGINFDTGGLKWMQTQQQKGVDALNFISQQMAINDSAYAEDSLRVIRTYTQNTLQASQDATQAYNMANKNYNDSIKNAKADYGNNTTALRQFYATQQEKYSSNIYDIDKDLGDKYLVFNKEIRDSMDKNADNKRADEQLGWNILNQAIDNYGRNVPQSIIDRVSKMLPAGTDIQDVINTPTFAERNSKRISGAGGSGSGSAGSYDIGSTTGPGTVFSGVTSNQLKEAVDRITLNFGGTAGERDRKRAEYLGRIDSGESTVSIMNSMQNDYWVSQKGAPKTAHDGRTDAQSSADALSGLVDYYGIGVADDGPLGPVDSRVGRVFSWFGQSSEEYNNLANYVGNIRAKIVKENYGSAVTPQELALAKSYIPDMTQKGSQFLTNVQNLKAYNQYLDAKVFARNVGLPDPTPPKPITLTGPSVTGPGKYSPTDINSMISE